MDGKTWRNREWWSDRGASLVEYTLLVALIAFVCFVAIIAVGDENKESLDESSSTIADASN